MRRLAILLWLSACAHPSIAPRPAPAVGVTATVDAGTTEGAATAVDRHPSNAPIVSLAAASATACALHADGTVSCWGSTFGPRPQRALGVDGVAQIVGGVHGTVYARTTRGDVYALSSDVATQLALAGPAVELSESCAVLANGRVTCWNYEKKIGMVRDVEHATHVGSAALDAVCVAHEGKVTCGDSRGSDPDVTLPDVEELAVANDQFRCARTKIGDVVCWGSRSPRSAFPTLAQFPVAPVALGLRDAIGLTSNASTLCAVRKNRTSICLDTRFGKGLASHPGPSGVELLRLGGDFECGLADGHVTCWGSNEHGQLGIGIPGFQPTPAIVPGIDDATAVHVGGRWSCALRRGGKVSCWGNLGDDVPTATPVELRGLGNVVELGGEGVPCFRRDDGRVGCRRPIEKTLELASAPPSESFAVYFAGCAIASGAVRCWDGNRAGQYGDGTSAAPPRSGPGALGITDAKKIALGPFHACLLRRNGEVVTFGDDLNDTVLGDAQSGLVLAPRAVAGFHPSVDVAAGLDSCCAVRTDGRVDCFGRNDEGQLGDGTLASRASAVEVLGVEHATAVASRYFTTCALASGNVHCWGNGARGALGSGSTERAPRASLVAGLHDAIGLSVGDHHACALTKDGRVSCWGEALHGETGTVVSASYTQPQPVAF